MRFFARPPLVLGFVASLVIAGTSTLPVLAQASVDAASRDDVLQMFAVLHLDQITKKTMEMAIAQSKANLVEVLKSQDLNVTDEQVNTLLQGLTDDYPLQQVIEASIPAYRKHFSKVDIQNIIAFFSSPTGQKWLDSSPQLAAETMEAANPMIVEWQKKMMTKVLERAKSMHADQDSQTQQPKQR
jgi:hypothetical protein